MSVPRALVTGGTGYIGRHLLQRLLAAGWDLSAVRRPGSRAGADPGGTDVRWITMTEARGIRNAVVEAEPDVVFHLAAHQARTRTPEDVSAFLDANVAVGTHLLDAVAGSPAIVVTAMSYFQYFGGEPFADSLYAATKQAYGAIADFYRVREGVDVREVILYDNYGPGDDRDKLVPLLLRAARSGSPVVTGPLEQRLNLLYIHDLTAGLMDAATPGVPSLMTVRAPEATTVGELVERIEAVSGTALDLTVDASRRTSDQPTRAGDWPTPPGWEPTWSLADGLSAAFAAS